MKLVSITEREVDRWRAMRVELYGQLEPGFHDAEMPNILHRDDWYCWLVIAEDGSTIGMVELSLRNVVDGCLSSPVPYIEGLFIEAKQRNRGLGRQLMQILFDWCCEQGYTELALNTEAVNTAAQRFYDSLGFQQNDSVIEYRMTLCS